MQLELLIGVQLMMPLPPFESTLRYLFEFTHNFHCWNFRLWMICQRLGCMKTMAEVF
jgi:hypothetical protein